MRWSASSPVTWPTDAVLLGAWQQALAPLLATTMAPDGTVAIDGAQPGDPGVVLVEGTHLQPGAAYRIAPELTTGTMRAWVGDGRSAGGEWAPVGEPGRAHVELQTLDVAHGVRGESTLENLSGRFHLALTDPAGLVDLEVEFPWLRVNGQARITGGELHVELRVRGLGMWWPTLAPIFLGARSSVQRDLETSVAEAAESITSLARTGTLDLSVRREPPAELQHRHEQELRAGLSVLARRQRAVADTLDLLPWWSRTRRRWQAELAALPAPSWPSAEVLVWEKSWTEVEEVLTSIVLRRNRWRRSRGLDEVVATFTEDKVRLRRTFDADVEAAVTAPRVTDEPWLTDESTDLSWLATPWKIINEAKSAGDSAGKRAGQVS